MTSIIEEITSDPRGYGYAPFIASGSDDKIAAMLNLVRSDITITVPVLVSAVKNQLFNSGYWAKIIMATSESAKLANAFMTDNSIETIDLQLTKIQEMLSALVTEGLITEEVKASILSLGVRNGSRAEELGFDNVTAFTIAAAFGR